MAEQVVSHIIDPSPDGRNLQRMVQDAIDHHRTRGFTVKRMEYGTSATANGHGDARWLSCTALLLFERDLSE